MSSMNISTKWMNYKLSMYLVCVQCPMSIYYMHIKYTINLHTCMCYACTMLVICNIIHFDDFVHTIVWNITNGYIYVFDIYSIPISNYTVLAQKIFFFSESDIIWSIDFKTKIHYIRFDWLFFHTFKNLEYVFDNWSAYQVPRTEAGQRSHQPAPIFVQNPDLGLSRNS